MGKEFTLCDTIMPLPVKTEGCPVRELVFQSDFKVTFSVLFYLLLYFYVGKHMVCNSFLIEKGLE